LTAATRYFAALDRLNGAHEARLAVGTDWTRLAAEHAGAEAALRAALAEVPVIPDELTRERLADAILVAAYENDRRPPGDGFEWYGSANDMADGILAALSEPPQ
jgi:hypothetical protein